MNRWFSERGARRGLKLSALALALWLSWAIGFTHGSAPVPQGQATSASSQTPVPPCCQPAPTT